MPNLIWQLKDSKSCEGCPCKHDYLEICQWRYGDTEQGRPQVCIDELGD